MNLLISIFCTLLCASVSYILPAKSSICQRSSFPIRVSDEVVTEMNSIDAEGLGEESFRAPIGEIDRRRTFGIISHPDAGKTTLTEKLLLFGGAIQDAGAVKARADQRKATSDWVKYPLLPYISTSLNTYYLFVDGD